MSLSPALKVLFLRDERSLDEEEDEEYSKRRLLRGLCSLPWRDLPPLRMLRSLLDSNRLYSGVA